MEWVVTHVRILGVQRVGVCADDWVCTGCTSSSGSSRCSENSDSDCCASSDDGSSDDCSGDGSRRDSSLVTWVADCSTSSASVEGVWNDSNCTSVNRRADGVVASIKESGDVCNCGTVDWRGDASSYWVADCSLARIG